MQDLRPHIAQSLRIFGLPASVTVPGMPPMATRAIRLPPVSVEANGVMLSTDRQQAVFGLSRAAVPSLPRGTMISVPAYDGGPTESWVVETILGGEQSGEPHPDDDVRVIAMRFDPS